MRKKIFLVAILSVAAGFFYPHTFEKVVGINWANPVRAASDIVINELAWMGMETSANAEWMELYNPSEASIDLTGWTLKATDGSPEITLNGSIQAGGYFLLERTSDETVPGVAADQIYTGALSNAGEILELRDAGGALVDKIDATGEAGWPAGDNDLKLTMERKADKNWQSSVAAGGTPKAVNSSGATSPQPSPSEGEGAGTSSQPPASTAGGSTSEGEGGTSAEDIIISEIMPDPVGIDENDEWIELYNEGGREADLSGWILSNSQGQKYELTGKGARIPGDGYLVIYRRESKIFLSNEGDTIKLVPAGKTKAVETIKYKGTKVGQSYGIDDEGKWFWARTTTPGEKNIINHPPAVVFYYDEPVAAGVPVIFDSSDSFDSDSDSLTFRWDFGDGGTNKLASPEHTFLRAGSFKVKLTVNDGQDETMEEATVKVAGMTDKTSVKKTVKTVGTKKAAAKKTAIKGVKIKVVTGLITASGVVAVEPGILGAQFFYLLGEKNWQVYNYNKDFPELAVGDRIEVRGTVSEGVIEPRIKTKSAADIKVLGDTEEPAAVELACENLNDEHLGELVKLSGEVVKKQASIIILDDESGEAEIYLKPSTGLSTEGFNQGDKITVSGILSKTKSGLRLLPRGLSDIVGAGTAEAQMLGEATTSNEWALPVRDKKTELLKYLLVIAGGAIVVLVGLLIKYRKKE
jgi:hypothetical protein